MKRFLIGLLLALPMLSSAQSKFQRGYIVTNAADTLKGLIDYRPSVNTPSSIKFKSGDNAAVQTFTTENCKGYGIPGDDTFERYEVSISQGTTKTEQLKAGLDTTTNTAVVFLKLLQGGSNTSLYSYTDKIKQRFYLKESGSSAPYELIRSRYMEDNRVVNKDRYKGQLLFEMRKYNTGTDYFEGDMASLNYTESDLVKIVAIMNRDVVRVAKKKSRFFIGAGITSTGLSYTGQHPLANKSAIKTASYMPAVSAGVDLFSSSTAGFFVYRAELSVFMGKDLKVVNGEYVHSFDHLTMCLNPKVMANLYNTEKIKAFIGVGAVLNYTSFSNNMAGRIVAGSPDEFIPVDVALTSASFTYNFNAGVLISKKFEVGLSYTPPYSMSNYTAFVVKMEVMSVGFKYHFDK